MVYMLGATMLLRNITKRKDLEGIINKLLVIEEELYGDFHKKKEQDETDTQ